MRTFLLMTALCSTVALCISPARADEGDAAAPERYDTTSPAAIRTVSDILGIPQNEAAHCVSTKKPCADLAGPAIAARQSRKAVGKTLAIAGFTLAGVGGISGYLIMLSGPLSAISSSADSSTERRQESSDMKDRMLLGLGIMAASLAVGLPVGIVGVVKMAQASEAENNLYDYYERTKPLAPTTGDVSFVLPVVKYTF